MITHPMIIIGYPMIIPIIGWVKALHSKLHPMNPMNPMIIRRIYIKKEREQQKQQGRYTAHHAAFTSA